MKEQQTKLPKIAPVKRTEKSSKPINPNKAPWITFNKELKKTVKEQVAAAWIELQPKVLYIGIN